MTESRPTQQHSQPTRQELHSVAVGDSLSKDRLDFDNVGKPMSPVTKQFVSNTEELTSRGMKHTAVSSA